MPTPELKYAPENEAESIKAYVNSLIKKAKSLNATDIHLESQQNTLRVRLRIDGHLREIEQIHKILELNIIGRIKLMSHMSLENCRTPQDGQFSFNIDERTFQCRVSSVPSRFGESVVIRLLEPLIPLNSLESLGMSEPLQQIVTYMIQASCGLVLITGPTGSGKTTTAHTILKQMDRERIKLITIEDPVEYELNGSSQIKVETSNGMTFERALKAILRQVPDVVFIGEIRDAQTAHTAIEAALTGHKIYATMHTNDAASVVERLIELGVERPFLYAALRGIVHQRLIRAVCAVCSTLQAISVPDKQCMDSLFDGVQPNLSSINVIQSKGCLECQFTGYKGRIGIFEAYVSNIIECGYSKHSSELTFKKRFNGRMLKEDCLQKIIMGITTLEEILPQLSE